MKQDNDQVNYMGIPPQVEIDAIIEGFVSDNALKIGDFITPCMESSEIEAAVYCDIPLTAYPTACPKFVCKRKFDNSVFVLEGMWLYLSLFLLHNNPLEMDKWSLIRQLPRPTMELDSVHEYLTNHLREEGIEAFWHFAQNNYDFTANGIYKT